MLGRCFFLTFTGKSGILYMYCTASFFPAVTPGRVATAPGAFLFLRGRPGNVSTCGLRPFPALLLYTRFQMRIAACPIPPHAAALPHGACIPQTRAPLGRPSAKADTRTGPVSQTVRHGLAYGRKFRFASLSDTGTISSIVFTSLCLQRGLCGFAPCIVDGLSAIRALAKFS